jgi:uncharacterized membrane-anchored protein YitT (DUF2179 family)
MPEGKTTPTPRPVKFLVFMIGLFIGMVISRFTFQGLSIETFRGFFPLPNLLGAIIAAAVIGYILLIISEKMERGKKT